MVFDKIKFLKVVMLAALALCVCSGVAEAKNATKAKSAKSTSKKNSSPSAASAQKPSEEQIKQIFDGQPPMTEEELNKLLKDYPKVKAMTSNDEAVKFLESEGWTPKRMTYIMAKTSLTRDVIRHGGGQDVINKLPKLLRPQKGEMELVKKYLPQIDEVLTPKKEMSAPKK